MSSVCHFARCLDLYGNHIREDGTRALAVAFRSISYHVSPCPDLQPCDSALTHRPRHGPYCLGPAHSLAPSL
jgi:hypothetical protein